MESLAFQVLTKFSFIIFTYLANEDFSVYSL